MKITQVQVFIVNDTSSPKFKAFAKICIEDSLMLTGLRVYQGTNGLFVAYPNDPRYKGEDYKQLFYPVSMELRKLIEDTVLEEYEKELAGDN